MIRTKKLGIFTSGLLAAASLCSPLWGQAQPTSPARPPLHEPVYRVGRARIEPEDRQGARPLDAALQIADSALQTFRSQVQDYTATVVKREQINGKLTDYEYMFAKFRTRKFDSGRMVSPLHVYMYFLKPDAAKGREVIWVEGRNDNKLRAHEGGTKGKFLPTVWLPVDHPLAMHNQRYPISEIGIENLIFRLIERGQAERKYDDVQVRFLKNAKINGRQCTLLLIEHPVKRDYFEFYQAQIFIDDELNLPIRYAAYYWPEQPGAAPPVLEEYTYLNLKINVGLTDADFDPDNPQYNF